MGRSHDRSHNNSGGNGYTPAHHTYGTQSYPSPNIHGVQNGANGGVIIPGSARDHNNNSDRSPLLSYTGRRDRNAEESPHAIFLRICHSPWSGINQTALTWIRGLIALYMVVAAIFIGVWWFKEGARNDCDKGGNGKDGGDKGGKGGSGGEGDKGGKDGGHKGKKNETEVMVAHVARGVLTYVGHMIIETGGKKNETHGGDGKGDDSCGREEGYLGGQGWIGLWKFETLSYFIQTVYFVLAFVSLPPSLPHFSLSLPSPPQTLLWDGSLTLASLQSWCLMHLVSPRHSTNSNPSFGEWLKKKLSHPTGECAVWFSIFYTAAISFPHVVVLVWWSIVVPVRHIDGTFLSSSLRAERREKRGGRVNGGINANETQSTTSSRTATSNPSPSSTCTLSAACWPSSKYSSSAASSVLARLTRISWRSRSLRAFTMLGHIWGMR